jgi:hypothetical protein
MVIPNDWLHNAVQGYNIDRPTLDAAHLQYPFLDLSYNQFIGPLPQFLFMTNVTHFPVRVLLEVSTHRTITADVRVRSPFNAQLST